MRFLDRLQPLGLLVLRVALGVIMVAHGYPKVFGGVHHFAQNVAGMGLPGWTGYLSAFAEFFGGILVIAGFLTRPAALAICIDMAVAIWKVHWKNGLVGANRSGYEFPLALAVIAFALIFFGAGPIAVDHVFGRGGGSSSKR